MGPLWKSDPLPQGLLLCVVYFCYWFFSDFAKLILNICTLCHVWPLKWLWSHLAGQTEVSLNAFISSSPAFVKGLSSVVGCFQCTSRQVSALTWLPPVLMERFRVSQRWEVVIVPSQAFPWHTLSPVNVYGLLHVRNMYEFFQAPYVYFILQFFLLKKL